MEIRMNKKELEEAAGAYLDNHKPLTRYNWGDLMDAFIAGAEWMKAKMLEGAVEGRIGQAGFHNSIYIKEPEWCDTLDKFNQGDRVRVLIVNDDEK